MCKCKFCGKSFVKKSNSQKYCSESCKREAKKLQDSHNSHQAYTQKKQEKPKITATCEYCGKPFIKSHGNQKYCSKTCSNNRRLEQNAESRMKSYHKNKKRGGDKFYGLGSGGLGPHMHQDWETEKVKINNELKRLKLRVKTYP